MSPALPRRTVLGAAAGTLGLAGLGTAAAPALADYFRPGHPGRLLRSRAPLPKPYQAPLPVPPVLEPSRTDATTDYYEITQREAVARILPGLETPLWAYEGTFPGPTLVSRSGRRTVVRHRNELPQPVVVHLHGGHTPEPSDGYPTDLVLPAGMHHAPSMADMGMEGPLGRIAHGSRTYTYPLDQRAATLWYHDHRMGFTGGSVWRGLAGFHLVHDDEEERLPLPHGDRDIPLMLTDRAFEADGSWRYPAQDPRLADAPGVRSAYMNGVLGDVQLVNGAPWPVLHAQRARYRLRLLNASNARRYRLRLDPPPPGGGGLVQIGGDGGLLEHPVVHESIDVAPAERFDIVVDFSRYRPGTRVELRNDLAEGGMSRVMCFQVSGSARAPHDDSRVPQRLSRIRRLDPADAAVTRTFLFQRRPGEMGWSINGEHYLPGRTLAAPRLGRTEIWRFVTDFHHPIHLHLNPFQVVSRNGEGPGEYDAGWKDTIDLRPAEAAEIAVRFTDHAGRFMLHCHNLEHEDMAMMADFVTR